MELQALDCSEWDSSHIIKRVHILKCDVWGKCYRFHWKSADYYAYVWNSLTCSDSWQHTSEYLCRIAPEIAPASSPPIDGFHSIFSLGNWRALHHHAACWLVNIHITWPSCPPVSMVKDAMESVYNSAWETWLWNTMHLYYLGIIVHHM